MSDIVYNFPSTESKLIQLSGSKTLFKKQLIRFGEWIDPIYPDEVMRIDRVFLEQILRNFRSNIPGRIPVPLTHTNDPEKNTGELVDLIIEGDGTSLEDGLYGILEIRREETADDIRNELIFDVSISFSGNYVDTETGAQHGPTLLHVALVNNPYIKKMGGFKSLSEELQKFFGADLQVRSLSETAVKKEPVMTKVKNEREFPVTLSYQVDGADVETELKPGDELELSEDQVEAVEKQLSEAEAPVSEDEEAGEGESADAEEGAEGDQNDEGEAEEEDTNLSDDQRELHDARRELAEMKAEKRQGEIDKAYETALSEGKVVPAQEEAFRSLADAMFGQVRSLSDGTTQNLSEVFAAFVATMPKVIELDEEKGTTQSDDSPTAKLSEETKQALAKQGISEEAYAKYGAKESISISELSKKES